MALRSVGLGLLIALVPASAPPRAGDAGVPARVPAQEQEQEQNVDVEAARAALARLAKAMEGVQRLRARYVQTQESLLLDEPIVSKGVLHLRADPGCVLLELVEPRRVLVRSDLTSHQVYWPDDGRAERWLFRSNEIARALLKSFSADVAKLEEAFAIRGYARRGETSVVTLVPRDEKLHRFLASLELTIADESGLLVEVAHANAEGERVRFALSEVDLEPDPDEEDRLLDQRLPDGVRLLVHEVKEPAMR